MRRQPIWVWLLIPVIFGVAAWWVLHPVVATDGRSPGTICISNLRQLDLALVMYATDADDKPPLRDAWMDLTEPYSKTPGIEHCPSVTGPGLYGYALNATVKSMKKDPSTTPLVYDSVNLARNASDTGDSMPKPGRHQGWNNVGYVDGHAHWVDARGKEQGQDSQ